MSRGRGKHAGLSLAEALDIRERCGRKEPKNEIADDYGISTTLVRMIARGERWADRAAPLPSSHPAAKDAAADRAKILDAMSRVGPAHCAEIAFAAGVALERCAHLLREMKRHHGNVAVSRANGKPLWTRLGDVPPSRQHEHRALPVVRVVPVGGWGLEPGANRFRREDCTRIDACLAAWCAHSAASARCPKNCTGYQPISRDQRIAEAVDGRGRSMVGGEW